MLIPNTKLANLRMLEFAAIKLGPLNKQIVFLGGCTLALFITDNAAPDVRATLDVDCIIDVASPQEYHKVEAALLKQKFNPVIGGGVICRWQIDDLILDVKPTNEKILGFGNCWYAEAMEKKISYSLTDNINIYSVSAPYFLATKFEAFKGRGKGDYLASHDLEDIIAVIDGRRELVAEVLSSPANLRSYLAKEMGLLINNAQFLAALPGHLRDYGNIVYERTEVIIKRLRAMVEKES